MLNVNQGGNCRCCCGLTRAAGLRSTIEEHWLMWCEGRRNGDVLMSADEIKISLVVATLGRTEELGRLLDSLAGQDRSDFEVIVVDQNSDDRLQPLCRQAWPFQLTRIHTPNARGLSRARNVGWKVARGELLIFPDDDCWYPPWFLSRGVQLMAAAKADVVTGRAVDEAGNDINGKYSPLPQTVNRSNVWISGIEWVMLFRQSVLLAVNGFDEDIGVGASTPWQACEGQDILLRVLDKGFSCRFDPAFFGHHARFDEIPPKVMQAKGRAYARGLGYVLRVHRFGYLAAANFSLQGLGPPPSRKRSMERGFCNGCFLASRS
jgi:glycosyltransferase involved in cell wall biosynthesis